MAIYQIHKSQFISASIEQVWDFISDPRNLKDITPDYMGFEIISEDLPDRVYPGMIIVYRVSPITYWVGRHVVSVPHIGLVNLVAEEAVVPELIQDEVTPERLAREAVSILEDWQRKNDMIKKLNMVKKRMGEGGASEKTARIALEMIGLPGGIKIP